MSSSNHALASLVTQVTKVPDDSYTPNDASSGTPYGTPGTPSSLPLVKPHGATTTVESKRPSMLDFLIRSFAACFVKDANNNSPTTASPPSPSAPLTLQTAPAPPVRTIEKPKEVAPKKPVTTNALIPEQSEDLKGRKLLVLDLDETLVHSCFQPVPNSDFIIPIVIEGVKHTVYVLKRPFVDDFLYEMSKIYEIVVFTASVALYANPLLDLLDPHRVIKHRLFREHCTFVDGSYVKDLSRLGRDMGDIIIIDNSKNCYKFQPDNAMPSITWLEDKRDNQLARMIPYLVRIGGDKQVYEGLREFREAESTIWTSGQQW